MQNISLLPAVLAFALSVAMGPVLIPVLKRLRVVGSQNYGSFFDSDIHGESSCPVGIIRI